VYKLKIVINNLGYIEDDTVQILKSTDPFVFLICLQLSRA